MRSKLSHESEAVGVTNFFPKLSWKHLRRSDFEHDFSLFLGLLDQQAWSLSGYFLSD